MSLPLFSVTVPTRNRPKQLRRCLQSLAAAREQADFTAFVCDSSTDPLARAEVIALCETFRFVELHHHCGTTRAAARNTCVRVARSQLIVTVDDDVYVEPDAVTRLVDAYLNGSGPRAVCGSMDIGGTWSTPVVMRHIGYGRSALPGESPSFLPTGFLVYPRAFALVWPWNERVSTQEDQFMGALWRRHGIQLLHEPAARAVHEGVPCPKVQDSRIYVNLFDALIAGRDPLRAVAHELLGFAAGAKLHCRSPRGTLRFLCAWAKGNRAFMRDRHELRALCETVSPLDPAPPAEPIASGVIPNRTPDPSPSLEAV
jgi:glycosyltransferase involved in cell wall biosynthesis